MSDKSLYVLAGFDDETEKRLAGIQQKLYDLGFSGTQTKNIPMHFTLGSFDLEKEQELKERLITLSGSVKAFRVDFNNIGLFHLPESDVLFAQPEVSKEMLELKDHFADNKDIYPWSAHTTFLIDRPDVIREALKTVTDEFKAFTGEVTTLYLYEFWPSRHILTVQLKDRE